jgi:hypothetical protein
VQFTIDHSVKENDPCSVVRERERSIAFWGLEYGIGTQEYRQACDVVKSNYIQQHIDCGVTALAVYLNLHKRSQPTVLEELQVWSEKTTLAPSVKPLFKQAYREAQLRKLFISAEMK